MIFDYFGSEICIRWCFRPWKPAERRSVLSFRFCSPHILNHICLQTNRPCDKTERSAEPSFQGQTWGLQCTLRQPALTWLSLLWLTPSRMQSHVEIVTEGNRDGRVFPPGGCPTALRGNSAVAPASPRLCPEWPLLPERVTASLTLSIYHLPQCLRTPLAYCPTECWCPTFDLCPAAGRNLQGQLGECCEPLEDERCCDRQILELSSWNGLKTIHDAAPRTPALGGWDGDGDTQEEMFALFSGLV